MFERRTHVSTGERFEVFRAATDDERSAVVLKTVRPDRPDARSEELLRHEWTVLRDLAAAGVARPLALEQGDAAPSVLVLEDAGPRNLGELLDGKALDPAAFLDLAIPMAATLAEVHRRGVIHRDVCPTNFVVGSGLTLVDFETATVTPAFAQAPDPPDELEGTLAYMAPEQTGRIHRGVDRRADLYALGATFYEMLTGAPPFSARDPLELLHALLARRPLTPAIVNAAVPTVLSDIVVKLLSKMPEWRYQSAEALRVDLEEARARWRSSGRIAAFDLGLHDVPYEILVSGHLYGREQPEARLREIFERVARGSTEVVLVAGPAGIGKSALVHRVRDLVGAPRSWLEGKSDALQRHVPYAPLLDAVRAFVREASQAPADRVAALRERLEAALSANRGVLTDRVPELRSLVGEPPPIADAGPVEAEHRFHRTFIAFVKALVERGSVLVLLVEDLQWADPASMKLLTALATEPDLGPVLVMGTYRTGDVADVVVPAAAARIRDAGTALTTLELGLLDQASVVALLCDALRVDPDEAAPLADSVLRKTAGNALSVRRFLAYLYEARLLVYDPRTGRWSWDLARVAAADVVENAVELLATSIARLSAREQDVLATAAVIGGVFGLAQLAGIRGEPLDDVARALGAPVRDGLLVPVSAPRFRWAGESPVELGARNAPAYRFVHDRVQEAALRSLAPAAQQELHLRIGRWMLANVPAEALDDAICPIVDHLDRATDRLGRGERLDVAGLNHRAGRVARAATAHASALRYFSAGVELLPEQAWATDAHELWFALVRDAAECAALTGDHARCQRLAEDALARTAARLEQAELGRVLAQAGALQGLHRDAIRHGRAALHVLGVALPAPEEASPATASAERVRTSEALGGRSDRDLLELPAMAGEEDRAALRLHDALAAATWFTAPDLFRIVAARAVALTVERGIGRESPFAFAAYAISLAMDEEYDDALRFGRLAVALAERASDAAQECRTLMVLGAHVAPWRAPLRESVPLLRTAYARGLESGDLEYAAYASTNLLFALWFRGSRLDALLAEADAALSFYRRIDHRGGIAYVTPLVPAARCLKGLTRGGGFDDASFDEAAFLRDTAENGLAQAVHHVVRLQTCYLLGDPAAALGWARSAERWLPSLRTIFLRADHAFYSALALASLLDADSQAERDALRAEARRHLDQLDAWARSSPATFGHKRDLAAAELVRLESPADARELYERAIAGARREGCGHDEALAHERCARFLAARGDREGAEAHLRDAVDGYGAWGALAKVKALADEHPAAAERGRIPPSASSAGGRVKSVDVQFLLRAAETLTSQLVLDRLLEKLMPICLAAASAERAALVLDEDGPVVRAVAGVDGVSLSRTPLHGSDAVPSSVVEQVLRTGVEVLLDDALGDPRFGADPYVARVGVRSVLAVPLRKESRAVGTLYFENNLVTGAFTPERVELFRLLAAQMGIALENSLLFEERHRAEHELAVLAEASAALSQSLEWDQVLTTVTRLVVPRLADWCLVDVMDGRRLTAVAARHAEDAGQRLLDELRRARPTVEVDAPVPQAQALRARRPLLVREVTRDFLRTTASDAEHLRLVEALDPGSVLALPLAAHGREIGVLTLVRCRSGGRAFTERDVPGADKLARRAALALDNARLHRDQRERSRHLKMIFRQAPGTIWATDLDLRFTHIAGNVPNAPELEASTVVGRTVQDVLGSRDPTDPAVAHHLAALAGEPQSFPYRFRDRWYEASIEPLRDAEHRIVGCVGAAFDVTVQRETSERLARSEARLAEAQRVAHVGSFDWDVGGNAVTWSDELHRIHGLEPGAFGGTYEAFIARVHPDDLDQTKTVVFDAYRKVKPFEYDHRVLRADGSVRTLHTRGDVIPDERGAPARVVGSCWDVTEANENVRELEHAVSRWEATLDATAEGILVVDTAGRISTVNHRFVTLWRIPAAAASRRDHLELLEPVLDELEDPPSFLRRVREIYDQPELESFDVVRFKDGRLFERQSIPQRIGDAVVGRVWSVRDVTERERLLRRALFLADATRLLASLDVEPALDSVAHLAVPFLANGCAVDLLGDGGGPRRLLAVSRDATQPMVSELHHSALAGHSALYPVGERSYMAVPLLVKGAVVGAITFAAAPSRRYTPDDLELAEELARRAALSVENARLYRGAQEALKARDEFLSIAAHEIRGPVTSMHLAVQGLLRGRIPPAATTRVLEVIQREDRRLGRFVDELLDIGRIRAGRMQFRYEQVDLCEVVRTAAARAAADLARSGSSLSVTTAAQCIGSWDRFRIEQVVTNLLSNAIKFGLGKPIAVSVEAHHGRASFVVADHGIGISPEMQDRVFLPFERAVAVRHYGGLGLGLFIARTVVEGLGGRISVQSTPSAGSTFTVELPRGRVA